MNFDDADNFEVELINRENSFDKFRVDCLHLPAMLNYMKNDAKFGYDRLNTIICIDLGLEVAKFELIYDLYSTSTGQNGRVSVLLDRDLPHIHTAVEIFPSAYFDECEIYDMFGINFEKNPNLKRLLMPKGWVGYPLRKDYEQTDKRLAWNEDSANSTSS